MVNIITKKNTQTLTGTVEVGTGAFETNFLKGAIGGGLGKGLDFDFFARRFEQADDFKMGNGRNGSNLWCFFLIEKPGQTPPSKKSKASTKPCNKSHKL